MSREDIDEFAEVYFPDSEALLLTEDHFDEAFIGFAERFCETKNGGEHLVFAIYDEDMVIDILTRNFAENPVDEEDDPRSMAWEYYDFNIKGAYVGPGTPAFIKRYPRDRSEETPVVDFREDSDE